MDKFDLLRKLDNLDKNLQHAQQIAAKSELLVKNSSIPDDMARFGLEAIRLAKEILERVK